MGGHGSSQCRLHNVENTTWVQVKGLRRRKTELLWEARPRQLLLRVWSSETSASLSLLRDKDQSGKKSSPKAQVDLPRQRLRRAAENTADGGWKFKHPVCWNNSRLVFNIAQADVLHLHWEQATPNGYFLPRVQDLPTPWAHLQTAVCLTRKLGAVLLFPQQQQRLPVSQRATARTSSSPPRHCFVIILITSAICRPFSEII